jgi:hypothetical protein
MTHPSVPAPSVKLTSFACPHCGAHATQIWHRVRLERCSGEHLVPIILSAQKLEEIEADGKKTRDEGSTLSTEYFINHFRRLLLGEPYIGSGTDTIYNVPYLENVFISECYTCGKLAIWLHDRLLYPPTMTGPSPNPDLSPDVLRDFEEARTILDLSPRGAAALLRLAIEKMCIELGAQGDDINKRIAFLVSEGLPLPVQQALDTVRVIGNEAVHPGQFDLRDDRETASKLFDLVNFIADDRITRPKQIAGLYSMIPEGKRDGIEERNAKALGKLK